MNWEALGAIGEIVGAVAVVVTIGYLAVQMRQNTRAIRASTNHAHTEKRNEINFRVGSDPSLADLALRGGQNLDDLDFHERYRHMLLMRAVLGTYEDIYVHYREGMCDEETWELSKVALQPIIKSHGFRVWWERDRAIFRSAFRSEIDAMIVAA